MSERYWITGAQLGLLLGYAAILRKEDAKSKKELIKQINKLLTSIEDEQFIGNMPEPYEDYEIVIRRKKRRILNQNET